MVWGGHDVQLGRENLVEAGHAVLVTGASAPVGSAHHCTHRKTTSAQQQQQTVGERWPRRTSGLLQVGLELRDGLLERVHLLLVHLFVCGHNGKVVRLASSQNVRTKEFVTKKSDVGQM
jgi:hypothetical protein